MSNVNRRFSAILSLVLAFVMVLGMVPAAFAAETSLNAGTYEVDATLSCYVNAMGGVEFSDGYGLLKGTSVTVDEDGNTTITLNLGTTSGLSVYGVPCTAFIGIDEAPGYYADGTVTKEGVTYTVSEDTVANASSEVKYITSITLPVDTATSKYTLWVYLDSNVMGCQLGDGSGTGSSNQPGVATKHTSTLTIDWDSAEKVVEADETSTQNANVSLVYEASGEYTVSIPATINVDKSTMTASYNVAAESFDIDDAAYVTVTASTDGILTNGDGVTTTFTNTLADGQLKVTGDTLAGSVSVEAPSAHGTFEGTITFTIKYFAGK